MSSSLASPSYASLYAQWSAFTSCKRRHVIIITTSLRLRLIINYFAWVNEHMMFTAVISPSEPLRHATPPLVANSRLLRRLPPLSRPLRPIHGHYACRLCRYIRLFIRFAPYAAAATLLRPQFIGDMSFLIYHYHIEPPSFSHYFISHTQRRSLPRRPRLRHYHAAEH